MNIKVGVVNSLSREDKYLLEIKECLSNLRKLKAKFQYEIINHSAKEGCMSVIRDRFLGCESVIILTENTNIETKDNVEYFNAGMGTGLSLNGEVPVLFISVNNTYNTVFDRTGLFISNRELKQKKMRNALNYFLLNDINGFWQSFSKYIVNDFNEKLNIELRLKNKFNLDEFVDKHPNTLPKRHLFIFIAQSSTKNFDVFQNEIMKHYFPNCFKTSNIVKVLMLSACPPEEAILDIEKEHLEIISKLQSKKNSFDFQIKNQIDIDEFKETIETYHPKIMHFSGHAIDDEDTFNGIALFDSTKRKTEYISAEKLEVLFNHFIDDLAIEINLVILNACYSAKQAEAIAMKVPFVIGTTKKIFDRTAIAFSKGFYWKYVETNGDIEASFLSGMKSAEIKKSKKNDFVLFKNGKKHIY